MSSRDRLLTIAALLFAVVVCFFAFTKGREEAAQGRIGELSPAGSRASEAKPQPLPVDLRQPTAISGGDERHSPAPDDATLIKERKRLQSLVGSLRQQISVFERSHMEVLRTETGPDVTTVIVFIDKAERGDLDAVNRHVVRKLETAPKFLREEFSQALEGEEQRYRNLSSAPRVTEIVIPTDPDAEIVVHHYRVIGRDSAGSGARPSGVPFLQESLSAKDFKNGFHRYVELKVAED